MSRVRNADEFLLQFRQRADAYQRDFGPRLSKVRAQYTGTPLEETVNMHLEFRARTYFVNAFLAALNWRMDRKPTDGFMLIVNKNDPPWSILFPGLISNERFEMSV